MNRENSAELEDTLYEVTSDEDQLKVKQTKIRQSNAERCKEYTEKTIIKDTDEIGRKKPKTNTERSKEYRERQTLSLQQENTDQVPRKSPAEYMKEYRRKKN